MAVKPAGSPLDSSGESTPESLGYNALAVSPSPVAGAGNAPAAAGAAQNENEGQILLPPPAVRFLAAGTHQQIVEAVKEAGGAFASPKEQEASGPPVQGAEQAPPRSPLIQATALTKPDSESAPVPKNSEKPAESTPPGPVADESNCMEVPVRWLRTLENGSLPAKILGFVLKFFIAIALGVTLIGLIPLIYGIAEYRRQESRALLNPLQ